MDPTSIATSATNLVGTCTKVIGCISTFINKSQTVHTAVRVLEFEINSLSEVLRSFAKSFNDPPIASEVLKAHTGHERQYWEAVKKATDQCNGTLTHLARVLEKAVEKGDAGSSWLWGNKQIKLSMSSQNVDILNQQVEAYRQTMQLAVHMIILSSELAHQADVSLRLDGLTRKINQLWQSLRALGTNLTATADINPEMVTTLHTCVRSAGKLVSSASARLGSRSQKDKNPASDPAPTATHWPHSMDPQQYENYIPNTTPRVHPGPSYSSSTSAPRKPQPQSYRAESSNLWTEYPRCGNSYVEKKCGHHYCELTQLRCCTCMDNRPHRGAYMTYVDGRGMVLDANRWSNYCPGCKAAYTDSQGIMPSSSKPAINEQFSESSSRFPFRI